MTRVAFPTDEHYPYQDDKAINLAQQIVYDFNPDIRIAGSDGVDFYSISSFDKDPVRAKSGMQYEIDLWVKSQEAWRDASPNAKIHYLLGNHEDRLRRYLWRHPEMYGLDALHIPSLLEFSKLGIHWEDEDAHKELNLFNKLLIKHGSVVRKHSAYTARAELEREFYSISTMSGHTHRGGTHYAATRHGIVAAHECFCLCDLNPSYISKPNWQQGIALAEVSPEHLLIEGIPFHRSGDNLSAIWRGKIYKE